MVPNLFGNGLDKSLDTIFSYFASRFDKLMSCLTALSLKFKIKVLRPGFEPGIVALRGNAQIPTLNGFQEYLELGLKLEKATVRNRMVYAKKYYHITQTWNLSELTKLSNEKRGHIMRALSLLSKYQGHYEKWQHARNNYQLKWSSIDSLKSFHNITNENMDVNKMIEW